MTLARDLCTWGVGAVAVAVLAGGCGGKDPSSSPRGAAAPSDSTAAPLVSSTTTTPVSEPSGPNEDDEVRQAVVDEVDEEVAPDPVPEWESLLRSDASRPELYAEINAGGGVDPATAASAVQAGRRLVTAELTGQGRDQFPELWGQPGRADICCDDLVIHAAGALPLNTRDKSGVVRVFVAWSARQYSDGSPLRDESSTVFLIRDGSRWRALQQWETPGFAEGEAHVWPDGPPEEQQD